MPRKSSKLAAGAVAIGTGAALMAALALGFEREFLSAPAGQAEVTVLAVQGERPQGRSSPQWFRYVVVLPDGTKGIFISDRLQRLGTRLIATVSRGRLSGRTWLSAPYRLVAEPAG
jgi:hypothetical protein